MVVGVDFFTGVVEEDFGVDEEGFTADGFSFLTTGVVEFDFFSDWFLAFLA